MAVCLSVGLIGTAGVPQAKVIAEDTNTAQSKNLIVFIGDGMGPAQVTAARIYAQEMLEMDELNMDDYYVGQAMTQADRSSRESGLVTDSASSATAFGTGNKTYNGAISVSNEDIAKPFASVIEAAEMKGKATGIISTARITHATPASYASHVRSRGNENAIAMQYLTSGVDVIFGGGKRQFITEDEGGKRKDKNLISDFEQAGYTFIEDKDQLMQLKEEEQVLGLFSNSHIPYVLDRDESVPTLAEMTQQAINILSQDEDGFVMMIEAGRIDHAGHANDLPSVVQETLEFDAAVKAGIEFAMKDGNTSVVVTADHETGGLSLSRDNIYELNVDNWDDQMKSSSYIGSLLRDAETLEDVREIVSTYTWITDLSDEEAQLILDGDGTSYQREGGFNAVVSKRLLVGWAGHGHSAVDVGVWAYGPIASHVKGTIENTVIATAGAEIAGLDLAAATDELRKHYVFPKFKMTQDEILFPAKAMAEALGAKVNWDESARTVMMMSDSNTVSVNVDSQSLMLNNATSDMTVDLDQGTLYLPLDAFTSLTTMTLEWDALSERVMMK